MIKKSVAAAFLVLLILLAVASIRAVRMPSVQPAAVPAVQVAVDSDAAVEHFRQVVRFPTVSYDGGVSTDSAAFRGLHAYIEEAYPLVHQRLQREIVSELSLLYTWEGTEPDLPAVVLMGHLDVVPVIPGTEGDWSHAPFEAELADGQVWGRGTMDDKVTVVSILEAVEALLAEGFTPKRTTYLAFGHDEEIGGVRGARSIAELLSARGAEPYTLVLDEGGAVARDMIPGVTGPVAIIGIAEKGYVNIELLVEGGGGHSSTPPANTNIGILASAIDELEEHPFPASYAGAARTTFEYLGPEMPFLARMMFANTWLFEPVVTRVLLSSPESAAMVRTTTAVTIVEGGVKANVLPIRARAVVNHRILPGETTQSVLAYVRDVISDERVQVNIVGDEGVDPSPVSDIRDPAFGALVKTIQEIVADPELKIAPYLVMGGTDAKYYSGRSPAVFRFLAAPVGPDGLSLVHGTNERMSVDGLVSSIGFYQQLLKNVDRLPGA